MKQKICILLSLNLLLSTFLPMFNYVGNAEANSSFENSMELINQEIEEVLNNLNFIETSELKTIFSIIEDDGILYEYESLVLNENTRDEKIAVSKYLIENGVRSKTVEYSEEDVYDNQLARFVPYASAIAGFLWFAGAGFKAISGNGQYGVGYHMARNPLTGNIYELVGIPWRQ
ncbi:hypothetical protein FC756_23485 [Lysinibacillus mangiferihumi]|uniref:Uncharacterized protein n=1 Tax=Lysinibacillus mangiferihumi TaxID=1130819 RepID=A0A4U2XZX5_9BACI|nr:hypothetical protein [Lysinibacillus mangiferihumi]TKI53590.1 hypothetical protein FC756_23485 [Lysinibacillus mangiferihumi]